MKIGIFGFAGAGKTTVFNILTGLDADTGYGGSKVNLGVTRVPDERIDFLADVYQPKKKVYGEITFADLPGSSPSKTGAGLDAQKVGELKAMDVLTLVLSGFDNPMSEGGPDPAKDFLAMESELVLSDLGIIERRLDRLKKEQGADREKEVLETCLAHLEEEKPLRILSLAPEQWDEVKGFQFLSQKTLLVLLNTSEDGSNELPGDLQQLVDNSQGHGLAMCANMEAEIAQLDAEEQAEFLSDLGVSESAKDRFLKTAFNALDLISFLTAGEDECRAWPIRRKTSARDAAGKIHTDIARGFIRAETIGFADFEALGSEQAAKAAGKYRLEGKEYEVQDGDIINFRFNV